MSSLGQVDISLRGDVISSETRFGDMENIVRENGCVNFIYSVSRTQYKYCLTKTGTLVGIYSGVNEGLLFSGHATAQPSSKN